jgi:alpha-D-ribose 1-methylphosphonate 5-triphosphate diphosphatase
MTMTRHNVKGGRILLKDGWATGGALATAEGVVTSVDGDDHPGLVWDASGLLVLPGVVDIHGDAFERQIMPRPGVQFDLDLALRDTDRQLIANGVTTAFHAVTWSWEPGLRGDANARAFVGALARLRPQLSADARLHLRWETFNLDAEAEILDWIDQGKVDFLAFNDHTPPMMKRLDSPKHIQRYAERSGLDADAFTALLTSVWERREDVPGAIGRLAARAKAAGVPMASHDDDSPETRAAFRAMGCAVAEFPLTPDTFDAAHRAGDAIVMGAPNVVRGGSHLSGVSASEMVGRRLCTVLASDYYYPALIQAAFRLDAERVAPLEQAWALISANPAAATGLRDRGRIAPGLRGDVVVVDPATRAPVATFAAGGLAWLSPAGAARLG